MKILKRLFVGSIVLVLLTTPLLVIAGVNEKIDISNASVYDNNSLGSIEVVHQPFLFRTFSYRGIRVDYTPPAGNPNYDYYFPEENGEVLMNFTLEVKHRLNNVPMPYFASWIWPDEFRFTWINLLYISGEGTDYFGFENMTACKEYSFENYTVVIPEEEQSEPLVTNGEQKVLYFYLYVEAAATPIRIIQVLTGLWSHTNALDDPDVPVDPIPIKIVPT